MSDAAIEKLRQQWDRAVERDKPKDALAALVELERLDPRDARWSHRAGDAHRRLGQNTQAEAAFERAMEKYAAQGFLPRAVAMAKLVVALNPARTDLFEKIDPQPARVLRAPVVPAERPSLVEVAKPLARAEGAAPDEVRFDDVEEPQPPSIAITMQEVAIDPGDRTSTAEGLAAMAACSLFADLERDALAELALASDLLEVAAGEKVISRDEPANALFVIAEGSAAVRVPGIADIPLREGDVFGEACLLEEGARVADVVASSPLVALRVPKSALDEIVGAHPRVADVLFELLVHRLLANIAQTSELFAAFDAQTRVEIARLFEVRRASAPTVLMEKGKRSDGLYLVLAGRVVVERPDGDARVARGTFFGQQSLVGRTPADDTVVARGESILLRLPATKFGLLVAGYPPALMHLADTAARPIVTVPD